MFNGITGRLCRKCASERGETQVGVIIAVVGFGCVISMFVFLDGCIQTHKESKGDKNRERWERQNKPRPTYDRKGYQVRL